LDSANIQIDILPNGVHSYLYLAIGRIVLMPYLV